MLRRPPRATRTATLFPYTTLVLADDIRTRAYPLNDGSIDFVIVALAPALLIIGMKMQDRRSFIGACKRLPDNFVGARSEEHTSELQSLMRISYAVFCLQKKNTIKKLHTYTSTLHITYKHLKT